MGVIEDFQREVPQEEWANWAGQYGASAPYFWAAQSGRLKFEGPAAGFLNLPPEQQDDWYGQYGEDAANQWVRQSGAGGTGATGSTSGTGTAGSTAVPPVARLVGAGKYQGTYGGQTVRQGDKGHEGIGFGQTVAPSTWNPANAAQGRGEGWGSIGAGTSGIQYGYGSSGFNKPQIKIDEKDLPYLSDPNLAPGYIPGSGTYNQYDLSKGGLFGQVAGQTVNTRYGLGGTGDPTTGHEVQTPNRYITGNMSDSATAEQGDRKARGLGGGGYGMGTGGGQAQVVNGTGGGESSYFGSTVTSNWGQTPETAGKDYIATLFLRSDTPTGIGTPAWSAPPAFWQGLIEEIRAGRIYIKNPQAWQMLAEKVPGTTPQSIGGAATGGNNVPPSGGAAGTGGTGTPNQQYGVSGTFQEGEETAFGTIKGGLAQGFGLEYHKILEERARREAEMAVEQAKLTGVFNGMPTLQAKELEEKIKQNAFENSIKTRQEDRLLRQQDMDDAFKRLELDQNIKVKKEEIASIAATGDKDRAQRETENLRLMEQQRNELSFKKETAVGYVGGQATVELQKFLADQQNEAYKRAANPAMAFENELARGATGWNTPGVSPAAAGVAGVTAPGQTLDQWYQAGGYAQNAQPAAGATSPYGYGYGNAGASAQTAQGYGGTAQGMASSAPVYGQGIAATQQAQTAAGQGAAGQQYSQTAQPTAAQQTAQQYSAPAQQTQTAQPAAAQTASTEQPKNPYGATTGGGGRGGGNPADFLIRTPGAVNAFRVGAAMPTAGNYGMANTLVSPDQAALTERDVRTQNLKQTRRMSPVTRALIGSYAAAGGVDADTFKFHSERKSAGSPGAASGSYSMK